MAEASPDRGGCAASLPSYRFMLRRIFSKPVRIVAGSLELGKMGIDGRRDGMKHKR